MVQIGIKEENPFDVIANVEKDPDCLQENCTIVKQCFYYTHWQGMLICFEELPVIFYYSYLEPHHKKVNYEIAQHVYSSKENFNPIYQLRFLYEKESGICYFTEHISHDVYGHNKSVECFIPFHCPQRLQVILINFKLFIIIVVFPVHIYF